MFMLISIHAYSQLKYAYTSKFSKGLADVTLNGKWGYIDKTGREIIPFKYDMAYAFGEGLVAVCLNDKFGFVDKRGKEIIPLKYDCPSTVEVIDEQGNYPEDTEWKQYNYQNCFQPGCKSF